IIHTEKAFQLLREEQEKEASYQNLIQQIETNQKNLHTTQREVDILQKEIMKHEKIMQILTDINELYHVNQEWEEIPKEISFPKDGMERLRSVKEAMLPLQSEQKFIENKLHEYERKQKELTQQLYSKEIIEKATTILQAKADYEQRSYRLEEKEKQYKQGLDQYQNLLYELEWEKNEATQYSFPFHLETD